MQCVGHNIIYSATTNFKIRSYTILRHVDHKTFRFLTLIFSFSVSGNIVCRRDKGEKISVSFVAKISHEHAVTNRLKNTKILFI